MNRKTKGKQKQKSTELLKYPSDSAMTIALNQMKMLGFEVKYVDWTKNTLEVYQK